MRPERPCEIETKRLIRKACRKDSELMYDFAKVNLKRKKKSFGDVIAKGQLKYLYVFLCWISCLCADKVCRLMNTPQRDQNFYDQVLHVYKLCTRTVWIYITCQYIEIIYLSDYIPYFLK